jgi:hypothetical protein
MDLSSVGTGLNTKEELLLLVPAPWPRRFTYFFLDENRGLL